MNPLDLDEAQGLTTEMASVRARCLHGRFIGADGCSECRLFCCPTCKRVRGWHEGSSDSLACDDCWAKADQLNRVARAVAARACG